MILLTQTPDDVPKWVARGCLCVSSDVVRLKTRTDLLMGIAAVQLPVDATVDVLYYRCRYRVLLISTSPAHAHLTAGTCASRRGAPLKQGWQDGNPFQSFIPPVFCLLCTITTSSRIPNYCGRIHHVSSAPYLPCASWACRPSSSAGSLPAHTSSTPRTLR